MFQEVSDLPQLVHTDEVVLQAQIIENLVGQAANPENPNNLFETWLVTPEM